MVLCEGTLTRSALQHKRQQNKHEERNRRMALTAKETALFKDAFVLFDRDARGSVTTADLEVVWSSMGRQFAEGEVDGMCVRC